LADDYIGIGADGGVFTKQRTRQSRKREGNHVRHDWGARVPRYRFMETWRSTTWCCH
jgi:hypothetical protein